MRGGRFGAAGERRKNYIHTSLKQEPLRVLKEGKRGDPNTCVTSAGIHFTSDPLDTYLGDPTSFVRGRDLAKRPDIAHDLAFVFANSHAQLSEIETTDSSIVTQAGEQFVQYQYQFARVTGENSGSTEQHHRCSAQNHVELHRSWLDTAPLVHKYILGISRKGASLVLDT